MTPRAFVLGGGVAGIGAALRLADEGHAVTLLEAHRWLGGRAFSRHDARLGAELDNGPHVMLGGYDAFRALLRRIGSEGEFERQETLCLSYREVGGRTSRLRLPPWPPRLALGWAALRFPALHFAERLRLVRGAVAALGRGREDETLGDWLVRQRQHGGPRRFLWEPLCRAIQNAPPSAVSARLFLTTLLRALGRGRAGAAIWFPRAGWSSVLGGPAERALVQAGVAVRFASEVVAIEAEAGRARALELRGGERIVLAPEDRVVCALPWRVAAKVLGEHAPAALRGLAGAAITTVHFAGLAVPDEGPLVCLVDGGPFHFVCRRPGAPADRFALLSSGDFVGSTNAGEAERLARAELARYYPGVAAGDGLARVVRVADATALFDPAAARTRPPSGRHPVLANVWLRGDAYATGLPSTLEGAAASLENGA